jgi:starch phosphorylase
MSSPQDVAGLTVWPGLSKEDIKRLLTGRHLHLAAKDRDTATERDWLIATTTLVRDLIVERWTESLRRNYEDDAKRVYYLSMEFLLGRLLTDALANLGIEEVYREALHELGLDYDRIVGLEPDAALGNGGLGRLAACLLESMSTLGIPGYGYGLRYEYGMFHQAIEDGWQTERPENWLLYGCPWEVLRPDGLFRVRFGGRVIEYRDGSGRLRHHWIDTQDVLAMAHDVPVPGYGCRTVNPLRLWSAKSTGGIDLGHFNQGDYVRAVEEQIRSENLSRVLYPSDVTEHGRELRFKQEYFFSSSSIQDILRRYLKRRRSFDELPDKVQIHINETHPALAIPEMMRLLVDEHLVDWDRAWNITRNTFAYTNHTLMPEALETWPVRFFETFLPRHLQIVYEINDRFLKEVTRRNPGNAELVRRMSLIDEAHGRRVRMAHLALVGSHTTNGVSEIHSKLLKDHTFADFHRHSPNLIVNVTNGISQRRWLRHANPGLSRLVTAKVGPGWITDLDRLDGLEGFADDTSFRNAFAAVKRANKERFRDFARATLRIEVDVDSIFDVQIKRIHEYKRQLLNALRVVAVYNRIKDGRAGDMTPRTVVFSGKAAPAYAMAKLIIKLIHSIGDAVNGDPQVNRLLKVVFTPNYNVTGAELIIPAADLSEQISTAGTEASGTGNMKLALNGALTIGTLDGANIEICQAVGAENMFTFGLTVDEAEQLRRKGYDSTAYVRKNEELRKALDMIASGFFTPRQPDLFRPIIESLTVGGDHFLVLADFESYMACQDRVDRLYRDRDAWMRTAILNVARVGCMSSDRSVRTYAERIWRVEPPSGEASVDEEVPETAFAIA